MSLLSYHSTNYGDIALIPYPPIGEAQETLEYYTDVLPSYTNEHEDRYQMRALPRQTIQYAYSLDYVLTQGIFNAGYSTIRRMWGIPFWTENQLINVSAGDTVYALDTVIHDIRANGMMLLFNLAREWQVVEVSAITATTATGTASALSGAVYAVPLRVGYIAGDISLAPTGFDSGAKIAYSIEDALSVSDGTTPPQYNGMDLYTDPYLVDSSGQTKISMKDNQYDYSVGRIYRVTPWFASQHAKQYQVDGKGVADIRALKSFFCRRLGKMNAFVSPTFESNLRRASTGSVASQFKFYDDGYIAQMSVKRKSIAFQLDDGTWQLRQASAPTDLGGGVSQITLDSALDVDSSRIILASYAGVNRLDTDRLEINHATAGYFTSSYQVLELTP